MKKTKVLLTLLCAVLLVMASVMGTMAYLTSTTQTVKNVFTVGKVAIKLDEAIVDADGKAIDGQRTTDNNNTNTYNLVPGHSYDKDPTITVLSGSEKSYVRMIVTVNFEKELDATTLKTKLDGIFTGYNSDWVKNGGPTVTVNAGKTVITYEYRYNTIVEGKVEGEKADNKLPALFTGITVPGTWTNNDLEAIGGFTINVYGQAIQADGFTTADAAWYAFENPAA